MTKPETLRALFRALTDEITSEAEAFAERVAREQFYVACVGQHKRGKSTLLNALVGGKVLPMGVVPVTTVPTVVRYGQRRSALRAVEKAAAGYLERLLVTNASRIAGDFNERILESQRQLESEVRSSIRSARLSATRALDRARSKRASAEWKGSRPRPAVLARERRPASLGIRSRNARRRTRTTVGGRDVAARLAGAAIEDAARAYRWLLDPGYGPRRIVVAGDSAGGGLTLPTLLDLREAGDPELFHVWHAYAPMLDEGQKAVDDIGAYRVS